MGAPPTVGIIDFRPTQPRRAAKMYPLSVFCGCGYLGDLGRWDPICVTSYIYTGRF